MAYHLIYGLLYACSLIPWPVMYLISDLLFLLAYHAAGYRKKVVMANLERAFPEKTDAERRAIARRFYRNFTDTIVETVKVISMSDREIASRFVAKPEMIGLIEDAVKSGKTYQLHAMHNFNWEIVNLGLSKSLKVPFLGVYMPLRNRNLERIFKKIRSRYGTILVPATQFRDRFSEIEKKYEGVPYALALVADQSPGKPGNASWLNFFDTPTAFVAGPEKAARERSLGVVFGNFYKVKRGCYTFDAMIATEDASLMQEGELTIAYVRYVEACIRNRPDNYLWSHRRWKHEYKPEYAGRTLEPLKNIS